MPRNELEIWRKTKDGEWYAFNARMSPRSATRDMRSFLSTAPDSAVAVYWNSKGSPLNATDAVLAGAPSMGAIIRGAEADAERRGPVPFLMPAKSRT